MKNPTVLANGGICFFKQFACFADYLRRPNALMMAR